MDTNSTIYTFEVSVSNISLVISMSLMCVGAICGNILVIVTVLGTKKLRTIPSVFLLNLSFCDLALGTFMMPLAIQGVVENRWIHGQISCQIVGILTNILTLASIFTVAAIALDRYFAIIHCFRYSSWTNWRYPTCVLSIIWVLSLIIGTPPLLGKFGHVEYVSSRYACLVSWDRHLEYAIFMFIMSFVLPFFLIMFSYLRIIRVARIHARRIGDINAQLKHNEQNQHVSTNGMVAFAFMDPIRRLSMLGLPTTANIHRGNNNGIEMDLYSTQSTHSNESSATHESRFQREAKAIIRLVSLIMVFLICWAPFVYANITMSVEFFRKGTVSTSKDFKTASFWLISLHCAINPVIYAIVSRRFRMGLRRLVKHRQDSFQNSVDNEIKTFTPLRMPRSVSAPIPFDNDSLKSEPEIFTVEQFLTETNEWYKKGSPNLKQKYDRRVRSSSDAFQFGSRRYLEVPGYCASTNSDNNIQMTSFKHMRGDPVSRRNSTNSPNMSISSVQSLDDSVFTNGSPSRYSNSAVTIKYDLVH